MTEKNTIEEKVQECPYRIKEFNDLRFSVEVEAKCKLQNYPDGDQYGLNSSEDYEFCTISDPKNCKVYLKNKN